MDTSKLNVFQTKWEKGLGEEPQARERDCAILELEMNSGGKKKTDFAIFGMAFAIFQLIESDEGQYGP
jgi:hypothetical protein